MIAFPEYIPSKLEGITNDLKLYLPTLLTTTENTKDPRETVRNKGKQLLELQKKYESLKFIASKELPPLEASRVCKNARGIQDTSLREKEILDQFTPLKVFDSDTLEIFQNIQHEQTFVTEYVAHFTRLFASKTTTLADLLDTIDIKLKEDHTLHTQVNELDVIVTTDVLKCVILPRLSKMKLEDFALLHPFITNLREVPYLAEFKKAAKASIVRIPELRQADIPTLDMWLTRPEIDELLSKVVITTQQGLLAALDTLPPDLTRSAQAYTMRLLELIAQPVLLALEKENTHEIPSGPHENVREAGETLLATLPDFEQIGDRELADIGGQYQCLEKVVGMVEEKFLSLYKGRLDDAEYLNGIFGALGVESVALQNLCQTT